MTIPDPYPKERRGCIVEGNTRWTPWWDGDAETPGFWCLSALLWVLTWALLAAALGEGDPIDASLPGFASLKKHLVFSQPWEKHLRDFKILRIVAHPKLRPFVIWVLIYFLKSHLSTQTSSLGPVHAIVPILGVTEVTEVIHINSQLMTSHPQKAIPTLPSTSH